MRFFALVAALVATSSCGKDPKPGVTPDHGRMIGGDPIRIEGEAFLGHGPPVVYVGNLAAKAIVVESRWLITAITPSSEVSGPVDVRIIFQDGETVVIPQAFVYEEDRGIVLRPKE